MDNVINPQSIDVAKDVGVTVTYYDGYVAQFDLVTLRQGCPCATCRNIRERGEDSWPRPGSPVPLMQHPTHMSISAEERSILARFAARVRRASRATRSTGNLAVL